MFTDDQGDLKVDFRANLSRHTKAVNVVRFSLQGIKCVTVLNFEDHIIFEHMR